MSMAAVSLIVGIVGTVSSTAMTIEKGRQEKKVYSQQARMYKTQAELQREEGERQAEVVEMATKEELRVRDIQLKRALSTQQAQYGASGISTTGSPLEVMMESAEEAARELSNIRRTGELQAESLRRGGANAAWSSNYQAMLNNMYGRQALKAGMWQGVSSAASGASSTMDIYNRYYRST
jgi:GAF domain-containing protein